MSSKTEPEFSLVQRLMLAVVPRLVWALFSVWGRTWRFEVITEEDSIPVLFGDRSPHGIFCFWHQCVMPGSVYFRHSKSVLLISRSFDGELITRTAQFFGYEAVRGSSSRGGAESLRGLLQILEVGKSAIFTADGPRGPRFQSKMGPVRLAQLSGAPISSFFLEPEHAWEMGSWDRFKVPKPFSRIVVSWAHPVRVATDLPSEQLETKRQELDAALERARKRALAHFGKAAE